MTEHVKKPSSRESLLAKAYACRDKTGVSLRTLGDRLLNDAKFFPDVENYRRTPKIDSFDRLMADMDEILRG